MERVPSTDSPGKSARAVRFADSPHLINMLRNTIPPVAWLIALIVLIALPGMHCGNTEEDSAARAEAVRAAVAEAEGGASAPESEGSASTTAVQPDGRARRAAITNAVANEPPPSTSVMSWQSSIAGDIEKTPQRSRELLALHRLGNDPRRKGEDLLLNSRWCDEGTIEACLHAGHVLLYNECLFDRARVLYEKAVRLASHLPSAALDQTVVDGRPASQELEEGLKLSDPQNRSDPQLQAIAAICGEAAERDRPLWDALFDGGRGGTLSGLSEPASAEEKFQLASIRKEMLIAARDRIRDIAGAHKTTGNTLLTTLADRAGKLCDSGDFLACATGSYFNSELCRVDEMAEDYKKFESLLATFDTTLRAEASQHAYDVIGPGKRFVAADTAGQQKIRDECVERHR